MIYSNFIVTMGFYSSVVDFLDGIYSWFIGLIDSIVALFGLIRSFFSLPTVLGGTLPSFLTVSVLVVIAIYVIRFLLLK